MSTFMEVLSFFICAKEILQQAKSIIKNAKRGFDFMNLFF
jgi:hypothetical protein